MDRIAVIGAGSWGTTIASIAAVSTETVLWARRPELAAEINETHVNQEYLPGYELSASLVATSDLAAAVEGIDALVMAVPSHGFRDVFAAALPHLRPDLPIVSLTKGIEQRAWPR